MPRKKKDLTKEQLDKQKMMEYLASVCSEPINYAATYAQLKKMMTENKGWTYNGIRYTLWFIKHHQGLEVTGIGIVPYWYQKAQDYYAWLEKVKTEVKNWRPNHDEVTIVCQEKEEVVFD